jgi:hypothetical protein
MERALCLEVVNGLEAIKQYKLQNTGIASILADLMFRYQIGDTGYLNTLVKSVLAYEAGNRGTDGKQPPISLTPDVLITSDYLAEKITPWVEIIRTELFGSTRIPFGNLKDAEDWILAHCDNRQPPPRKSLDDPATYRDLVYVGHDGDYRVVHILEPAPPTWVVTQLRGRASDYSPLNWLEKEIRLMYEATGFYQQVLVQFILMGTSPILARYDIRGQSYHRPIPSRPRQRQRRWLGDELLRISYVDVRIYAQDLTFVELREIYNKYREMLQLKKHKLREGRNLSISHWELYQLIKGQGGPPKGRGKVAFWESAKSEWNKLHRQHKYQTWKGVKIAYDRLIKQLEHRLTG